MIIFPAFSDALTADTAICGKGNKLGRVPPEKGAGRKLKHPGYGSGDGEECGKTQCTGLSMCACVLKDAGEGCREGAYSLPSHGVI